MNPYWTNGRATLYQGHVLDVLDAMDAQSVHMCATSPPYWGLRDYQIEGVEWPAVSYAPMAGLAPIEIAGCDPGCEHVWATETAPAKHGDDGITGSTLGGGKATQAQAQRAPTTQAYCQLCGGWRGSLGLEPTIEMYVGHLVLIWRALWRVLRDDGVCWLNLGDSYNNRSIARPSSHQTGLGFESEHLSTSWADLTKQGATRGSLKNGLKEKDLCAIPWRVALALQADGWYLRSAIIWAKGVSFCPTYSGSCMPGSQQDRPTTSHENVFLLTKKARYYYDNEAVREANSPTSAGNRREFRGGGSYTNNNSFDNSATKTNKTPGNDGVHQGRTPRTVWTINPGSFKGSHFATFPPKLVEPMIKAGTSAKGVCPECGAGWRRVMSKEPLDYGMGKVETNHAKAIQANGNAKKRLRTPTGHTLTKTRTETTGWTPSCSCGTEHPIPQEELDADPTLLDDFEIEPFEPVPAVVLDIFCGSGTTLAVADLLGRHSIGIELSKTYCDDHIIPRLSEPLLDWAMEQPEPEPQVEQMEMNL